MPQGSFGAPVVDAGGRLRFITAAHVVGSLSWAHELGRTDVLMGTGSGPATAADALIGHVMCSHPAEVRDEIELDAALVQVEPHVTLNDVVQRARLSGIPRDVEATADEDDPVLVHKRGVNQPQLTHGLLAPSPESLSVNAVLADGTVAVRDYVRGYFVYGDGGPFARPGDSGSIVVDDDDCVVGLLVALRAVDPHNVTAEDPAFVVPIVDILDRLDLTLPGPQRPCTTV